MILWQVSDGDSDDDMKVCNMKKYGHIPIRDSVQLHSRNVNGNFQLKLLRPPHQNVSAKNISAIEFPQNIFR